jgi:hypothetical protein
MYYAGRHVTKVLQEDGHMSNNVPDPTGIELEPLTIRKALPDDLGALRRLAQRDSARMIERPAIVAVVDGELRAAVSTKSGAALADPFYRTAELVELLRLRVHGARGAATNGRVQSSG